MAKGDLVVIVICIAVALITLGYYRWQTSHAEEGDVLVVRHTGLGEEEIYTLKRDGQFEVEGELGVAIVEVQGGKARFVSAPCPDQLCVNVFGWISKDSHLSFCLPNQVLLEIKAN
ncbi:MAG: NusG domain II-containing protein [Firmicutes bacterium]|nr:NusG domain II-containing protein [Bacillota bacterium]